MRPADIILSFFFFLREYALLVTPHYMTYRNLPWELQPVQRKQLSSLRVHPTKTISFLAHSTVHFKRSYITSAIFGSKLFSDLLRILQATFSFA